MDEEPKTAAEMKEIRLNRKLAQDAEGIKAMADIAAADIAIRKRTANLRAIRLAKEAADRAKPAEPNQSQTQEEENELDDKEDRNRADARFNKAARAANDAQSGKTERDAALKAVTDNMAKLKALRLAREAAEPPRPAARSKSRAPSRRNRTKRARHWRIGWRTSKAAAAAPEALAGYRRTPSLTGRSAQQSSSCGRSLDRP